MKPLREFFDIVESDDSTGSKIATRFCDIVESKLERDLNYARTRSARPVYFKSLHGCFTPHFVRQKKPVEGFEPSAYSLRRNRSTSLSYTGTLRFTRVPNTASLRSAGYRRGMQPTVAGFEK